MFSDFNSALSGCSHIVGKEQNKTVSEVTLPGVRLVPGPLDAQLRLTIPDGFLNNGRIERIPWEYVISFGQTGTYTFVKGRVHLHANQLVSAAATGISRTRLNVRVSRWLNKANKQLQKLFELPGEIVFEPTTDPSEDYAVALQGPIPMTAAYYDDKGTIEGVLIINVSAKSGPYGIARNGSFFFDNRRIINARVDYRHKKPYTFEQLREFEYDVRL